MADDFKIDWQGSAVDSAMRVGATRGLTRAAEFVLSNSRLVVPIEDAILSRSGATSVDSTNLEASVSYDTPYAVRQHEDLSLRHDQGRTAKYLERPLVNTREQQARIIAQSMGGTLR